MSCLVSTMGLLGLQRTGEGALEYGGHHCAAPAIVGNDLMETPPQSSDLTPFPVYSNAWGRRASCPSLGSLESSIITDRTAPLLSCSCPAYQEKLKMAFCWA